MTGVLKRAKDLFGGLVPEESKLELPKRKVRPWHAVSIVPGQQCCAAASGLVRKRFLSREAPTLPLKACDQAHCSCRYDHHDDRRKGPRRASEMGVSVDGYDGVDKRGGPKRGRRKADRGS
jgi:hypothetical protein